MRASIGSCPVVFVTANLSAFCFDGDPILISVESGPSLWAGFAGDPQVIADSNDAGLPGSGDANFPVRGTGHADSGFIF